MEAGILGKTAVCLVGGGGVVFAGCYAGGIIKFGSAQWTTLFQDSNFNTTYNTADKIGKDYGQYLVDTEKNEEWWKESYEQYKKDIKDSSIQSSLSTDFGPRDKVTSAYSENDVKALNKVCESVYKKATNEISFESESGNEYKLGKDLFRYCSPLGEKPTIIPQGYSAYGSGKIGNTGHSSKLVSTQDSKNKGFWEAQQKWFKDLGNSVTDKYFGQFFQGDNPNKKLTDDKDIRDICNGAYGKEPASGTSNTSAPTADAVAKYCTFAKISS